MENPFQTLLSRIDKLETLLTRISDRLEVEKSDESSQKEDLGDIQLASEITGLAVPTIYSKVSRAEIPCMKRGKKLYFSKHELIQWIRDGKKKTVTDLKSEVDSLIGNMKRA